MKPDELGVLLGPCGWPKVLFGNDSLPTLSGLPVSEILQSAMRIGEVTFSDLPDFRPVPAYSAEIDGCIVRFAFDEFCPGGYLLASNDAPIEAKPLTTTQ